MKLGDYLRSHLTFDCKYISEIPIVVFRPKMRVASGIDQLSTHADTIAGSLNGSFQNMRDAQVGCELAQISLPSLVLHH